MSVLSAVWGQWARGLQAWAEGCEACEAGDTRRERRPVPTCRPPHTIPTHAQPHQPVPRPPQAGQKLGIDVCDLRAGRAPRHGGLEG